MLVIFYDYEYSSTATWFTIHSFIFALALWTCFVFYKGHTSKEMKPPSIFSKWSYSFEWFLLIITKYRHVKALWYSAWCDNARSWVIFAPFLATTEMTLGKSFDLSHFSLKKKKIALRQLIIILLSISKCLFLYREVNMVALSLSLFYFKELPT